MPDSPWTAPDLTHEERARALCDGFGMQDGATREKCAQALAAAERETLERITNACAALRPPELPPGTADKAGRAFRDGMAVGIEACIQAIRVAEVANR